MGMKNYFSRKIKILILISSTLLVLTNCQKKQKNEAKAFDEIARTVFKDIYPNLAKQIKEDFSINKGICVEVGTGPGYLSIELAKITNLEIHALDIDPSAVKIAKRNIKTAHLSEKIKTIQGDVHQMPFSTNFADLIISRGSFIFWEDKVKALKEIYRILKPGGVAFVGGGLGKLLPEKERIRIKEIMEKDNIGPPKNLEVSIEEMGEILRKAGILNFEVTSDEGCLCGLWVELRKQSPLTLMENKAGRNHETLP